MLILEKEKGYRVRIGWKQGEQVEGWSSSSGQSQQWLEQKNNKGLK